MPKKPAPPPQAPLSRERIIACAIDLLDEGGEAALTFKALAQRLVTGAGALYWHIANKSDLLTAACDVIIGTAMANGGDKNMPSATLEQLALSMFDAMDAHPWIGSALGHAPGSLPMARLFDQIGQQVCALGVPVAQRWAVTSAFVHYILGVGSQNAANSRLAREQSLHRDSALATVATAWEQLSADEFPFATRIARQLATHDDREDFLAGVALLISGVGQLTVSAGVR